MEQIERIKQMEKALDEAQEAVNRMLDALDNLVHVQPQVKKISNYYGSPEWMDDNRDDAAGLLPGDLKRGVLSEDAAYDMLTEHHELMLDMIDVAAEILRNE